jgi:hypothetical protein
MAGATSALVLLMLLSAIASLVVASVKVTFSGLATARWSTTMLVFIVTGALGYARYVLLP